MECKQSKQQIQGQKKNFSEWSFFEDKEKNGW